MLRCTLRFCFKGHPGEKVVNAGFYLMLNARCHDRIVDRRYWETSVQCGAKFKMSIMVEDQLQWSDPCHRCGRPLTCQGFESALNWCVRSTHFLSQPRTTYFSRLLTEAQCNMWPGVLQMPSRTASQRRPSISTKSSHRRCRRTTWRTAPPIPCMEIIAITWKAVRRQSSYHQHSGRPQGLQARTYRYFERGPSQRHREPGVSHCKWASI